MLRTPASAPRTPSPAPASGPVRVDRGGPQPRGRRGGPGGLGGLGGRGGLGGLGGLGGPAEREDWEAERAGWVPPAWLLRYSACPGRAGCPGKRGTGRPGWAGPPVTAAVSP